jgi:hypothetical protein
MTTYVWPADWGVAAFSMSVQTNTRAFAGPYTATLQILDLTGERWIVSLETEPRTSLKLAGQREAFFDRLRGPVNRIGLWNLARPVPLGTLRDGAPIPVVNGSLAAVSVVNGSGTAVTVVGGTAVVSAAVAKGASFLPVTHIAGRTVEAGDMLGIGVGGQLVRSMTTVVFDGAGNAVIEIYPRVRNDVPANTPLVWNKPMATFAVKSDSVPVVHRPGLHEGTSLELIETT